MNLLEKLQQRLIYWNNPIIGYFVNREKRFFVYININGEIVKCYCSNTGKMDGLLVPGAKCILSEKSTGIKYQWEAAFVNNMWIGTNTQIPNKLAPKAIEYLIASNLLIPGILQKEVKFNKFRVDFKVDNQLIEVKFVHWIKNNVAYFPDCVTSRGARQLEDMMKLQPQYKCYNLYILMNNGAKKLTIDPIDKNYYNNSLLAKLQGIESFAFNCNIDEYGINLENFIEFYL